MDSKKQDKLRQGEKVALVSILTSLLLSISKAIIGFFAGSIILITDALHSGADTMTGFASWFGLKVSQKKPSERFHYGYYKAENLATLVVSAFILYAAFELLLQGYFKLFILSQLERPLEALGIVLVSSVVSYFLSRYMRKAGKKINSQSLIANSNERRVDVFSSLIVFVAILLTFFKIPYVEGIITMFISLLAMKIGIETAKDSIFGLMDVSPSKEIENKVKLILNSNSGIEDFEDLKLRKSGPFDFGEVNIKIRKSVDVKRAHEIADNIEKRIKEEISDIDSFTIHVEPYEAEEQKIVIPIVSDDGLDSNVMKNFGRANYFMFLTVNKKDNRVVSSYVKENPHKEKSVKAGLEAVKFIAKEKVDAIIAGDVGEISFHTLKDNLIYIYRAKGKTVGVNIDNFLKNKLENITEPKKLDYKEQTIYKKTAQKRPLQGGRFRRGRNRRWRK
jgi:cation diffusion facilitator family transporter